MKKESKPTNFLELMSSAIPQTIPFIKDYKALRHLKLSAQRHNLLLDILQYHYSDRKYTKSNTAIANDLVTTKDNVSQIITFLKKENLIFNIQLSNKVKEGDYRGSNHTLKPNLVEIAQRILTSPTYQEQVNNINEDKIWEMVNKEKITEEIIEESSTPSSDDTHKFKINDIQPEKLFLRYVEMNKFYEPITKHIKEFYEEEKKPLNYKNVIEYLNTYMEMYKNHDLYYFLKDIKDGMERDYEGYNKKLVTN